jgi:hypothetical protein
MLGRVEDFSKIMSTSLETPCHRTSGALRAIPGDADEREEGRDIPTVRQLA